MKKTRNLLLTFTLVFSFLFAIPFYTTPTKEASALMPNCTITSDTVYYFCDSYATLTKDTLEEEFPNNTVYVDFQRIDETDFASLINDNYFNFLGCVCTIIFDIKTFDPNITAFYNLIYNLRNSGCKVMLITSCAYTFNASSVDGYYQSNLSRFSRFVYNCFNDMNTTFYNNQLALASNIQIVLDDVFIDEAYCGWDVDSICTSDPFADIFIKRLETYLDPISPIAQGLSNRDFFIPVYTGNGLFDGLLNGETYDYSMRPTFLFGCSDFDAALFNVGSNADRVYLMEGAPIEFFSGGLPVVTEWDLAEMYVSEETETPGAINALSTITEG